MNYFDNVEIFYSSFYEILNKNLEDFFKKNANVVEKTKRNFHIIL